MYFFVGVQAGWFAGQGDDGLNSPVAVLVDASMLSNSGSAQTVPETRQLKGSASTEGPTNRITPSRYDTKHALGMSITP